MTVADDRRVAPLRRTERFPPDFGALAAVRRFAAEAAERAGLGADARYAVVMACSEAVANAIEHGSPAGSEVEVTAAVEADALAFYVLDSGRFVPRVRPRGMMPERGRGLAFMSEMMDEVQVRAGPGGTTVRLVKRLPGR